MQAVRASTDSFALPLSDFKEDYQSNLADLPMIILDPLISKSTFPTMPVLGDPPDTILNPPAMSEPDVEPANILTEPPSFIIEDPNIRLIAPPDTVDR